MASDSGSYETLEIKTWNLIERQLLSFENAWKTNPEPKISEYIEVPELTQIAVQRKQVDNKNLTHHGSLKRNPIQTLLIELIKIDLEHRWKGDAPQRAEEYFVGFPELTTDSTKKELIQAELFARKIAGKLPDPDEIANRFGADVEHWNSVVAELKSKDHSRPSRSSTIASNAVETVIGVRTDVKINDPPKGELSNLQTGDRVDRYLLRERIGQGAFSEVWKAIDSHLKRTVAIKIVRQEMKERDDSIVLRTMREARSAAAIVHPGVVQIHEVTSNENYTMIVEQFVDGPNLRQLIEAGELSVKRSVEVVRDISLAMHEAHRCGVIHRDIKPANIMMKDGQTPKIVDFGLACLDQISDATLTQQGELLGTPAYMSPQQAQGQHHLVDARSDIYSIGAVLYRLLTGQLPFGGSTLSTLDAVVNKTPSRAILSQNSIDKDLETIVLQCLEKDPSDRYQSAGELASELQRFLNHEPIKARPVGRLETIRKWSKRNPRAAIMIVSVVMLGAFLLGTLLQLRTVIAQRTRAENAEQQSQQLLLDSTKMAGRLAMQRGKMREAVKLLEQADEMSRMADDEIKLDLIESLISVREIEQAKSKLHEIRIDELPNPAQGKALLFSAQFATEAGEFEQAEDLFASASRKSLPPHLDLYAKAMLSDNSLSSLQYLRQSVELAPLSHQARRGLLTLLISLAEFEDARYHAKVAKQLFPDDIDFQLLEAIVLTALDQKQAAIQNIDGLTITPQQKDDWRKLCETVSEFRSYSHRGEAEFAFDEENLTLIADQYVQVAQPCLAGRGFVLPPKVAIKFASFFRYLESFQRGEIEFEAIWPELDSLTKVHPEGSLVSLQLSTLLTKNLLEEAFEQCKTMEGLPGYVQDTSQLLDEMRFVLSLVQYRSASDDAKKVELLRTGVEAIGNFEKYPVLIEKYSVTPSRGRALVVFLIEAFKLNLAEEGVVQKWLGRWKSNPNVDEIEALWFEAIIANRTGRYMKAMDRLQQMISAVESSDAAVRSRVFNQAKGMNTSIILAIKELTEMTDAVAAEKDAQDGLGREIPD